jgi:hypothetical protein
MSHTDMDAANKPQIVHPTQWMMAGHRMPTVHPTRWRWTDISDYRRNFFGGTCAVYFPEYGSWYRVARAHYISPIDGSVGWYEYELQCTPAYTNGEPDTEAWGFVDEHGFECMGMPEDHTHDPYAVQWMESINSALAYAWTMEQLNGGFKLEEFE